MDFSIYEHIAWALFAILKFVVTPSLMIANDYSWLETVITVIIGASVGFCAFFFFGEIIFKFFARFRNRPAKRFSRTNRWVIHLKNKYGILGLGLIASLLSVPVAGLLSARFFRHPTKTIPIMLLAFGIWTILLTSLSYFIRYGFR